MAEAGSVETIRVLYRLACESDGGLREKVHELLRYGCARFAKEAGVLTKTDSQVCRIIHQISPAELALAEGDRWELRQGDCSPSLLTETPEAISDIAETRWSDHPAHQKFGFRSYLGMSLYLAGEHYGALSFFSRETAPQASPEDDLEDLRLMGQWLTSELQRWQREDALIKMKDKFKIGFYAAPTPMLIVNQDGSIEHANTEAERLFRFEQSELVGKPVEILIPEKLQAAHPKMRDEFVMAPKARPVGSARDLLAQNSQGEVFPVEVGLNPIQTEEGLVILCAVVDLTERKSFEHKILEQAELLKQSNKLLSRQASTDSLTCLANRRFIMAKLEEYLSLSHRSGECVSLLLVDVDHFKHFNDSYGHSAGDEALKAVANELDRQTRDVDIVARYGGEEFIILLPATDREGAQIIAERVRRAVENIASLPRKITLSGGIATAVDIEDPTKDIDLKCKDIIEKADRALYWSKQHGRNRVTHIESCK